MAEFGWIDGRIVVLAYRWAAGHPERYPQTAAELATLKVDVVATSVNGGVVAMKQVAPATPIVMAALSSGSPFIESLSHPGGMVTGMSPLGEELGRKRLELLTQVARQLRHLAVVGVARDLKRVPETALVTSAAQQHGIQVTPLMVKQAEEIAPTIASIEGRAEALYVIIDPLISLNQAQFNMLALKAGLPTCTACLSM